MNSPHYPFTDSYIEDNWVYSFESIGPKGSILKLAVFQPMAEDEYYLALLDYDAENYIADDSIVTDNQDMKLILATVVNITIDFFEKNPHSIIFITGNHY